jgi:hypothetical protein
MPHVRVTVVAGANHNLETIAAFEQLYIQSSCEASFSPTVPCALTLLHKGGGMFEKKFPIGGT